jgi:phytoene dehydrogenase-like protein
MTDRSTDTDTGTDVAVTDRNEFERRLRRLIRSAEANGVEVRGGCEVEAPTGSGWDVEIVETRDPASTPDESGDSATEPP